MLVIILRRGGGSNRLMFTSNDVVYERDAEPAAWALTVGYQAPPRASEMPMRIAAVLLARS